MTFGPRTRRGFFWLGKRVPGSAEKCRKKLPKPRFQHAKEIRHCRNVPFREALKDLATHDIGSCGALRKAYMKQASEPRLIPVPDWNKFHPYPSQAGLRHLIFFAETNGFNRVVRRIGRRVLINEAAFFAWVDAQNGGRHD
jgi:hypothetical protein